PDIVAAAREASVSGMPVMRHLYLMYPEDPSTLEMVDQYMLGDRWLAAPVIRRGQREREVYFPRGRWRHWKSGQTYEGPAWQPIEAPLGLPPLFEKLDAPAP
ncbi:MAG: alpha-glucosidase, partial [Candidatus Wallbacteria bacterium]|nr:alpha-glucosidase [Candidatus Wallbacteria bacterium]